MAESTTLKCTTAFVSARKRFEAEQVEEGHRQLHKCMKPHGSWWIILNHMGWMSVSIRCRIGMSRRQTRRAQVLLCLHVHALRHQHPRRLFPTAPGRAAWVPTVVGFLVWPFDEGRLIKLTLASEAKELENGRPSTSPSLNEEMIEW